MNMPNLAIVCVALACSLPAFSDPIPYTEYFNDGSNPNWGTDYGQWSELFDTHYLEDGAKYWPTEGYTGGYDYIDQYWEAGNWYLIFADSDASGGNLAGNEDFTIAPSMQAYLKRDSALQIPATTFFFASTGDSTTDPTQASDLALYTQRFADFFYVDPGDSWNLYTADLTDSNKWSKQMGSGDRTWSNAITDVDLVGVMFVVTGADPGAETIMVDNFTVTPEPGLLIMMGPLAGFLGWRVRRGKKRNSARA